MPTPLPALVALLLALLLAPLSAQTVYPVKIGGGPVPDGDTSNVTISPDGTRAVFRAQPDRAGFSVLFSVPVGGGAPVRLSPPGSFVASYRISPDSSTVVFPDRDAQGRRQLFSVPIGGGSPTQLSLNTPDFVFINQFEFSPDGSRLVYLVDGETDNLTELFSVPVTGGAVTKLNPTLVSNGDVISFRISEVFDRVIYLAEQDTDTISELYTVPIAGGAAVKLNAALPTDGEVRSYQLTPNGGFAAYTADLTTAGVIELYTTSAQGGFGSAKRSGAMTTGGNVSSFTLAPNGGGVVYRADQDEDETFELYANSISGLSSAVKISGSLVVGGDVNTFAISSDSARVIYEADQETDGTFELYSVANSGAGLVKLSTTSIIPGTSFEITPDASNVVFRQFDAGGTDVEIFVVPTAGGAITKLNEPLVANGDVHGFEISPDSSRVVYRADQVTDTQDELFSVPIDGSTAAVRLNDSLIPDGDIENTANSVLFTPDSSRVLYLADQEFDEAVELFSVPAAGGAVVTLSPPPGLAGDIDQFQFSPDGTRVVYLANEESAGRRDLYSVPSRGGPAIRLTAGVPSFATVSSVFAIDPAGSRVFFRADAETRFTSELYSVPIDGGPLTKINAPLVESGDVFAFFLSPDGSQVAYVASQDSAFVLELYVVPTDLSSPPVKVSGPLVSNGDVRTFAQFTPDGSRVVFAADKETDQLFELFSAPTDGSALPVKLNGPAIPQADVFFSYLITPDGSRVIYRWDQEVDEQFELYSVPIEGGTVVKLNQPLPDPNSDVRSFQIASTGDRVVFNADQDTFGQIELYSIPVDGSAPPTKLNGAMSMSTSDVFTYALTPDGLSVLYEASQTDAEGLFIVPIDGRSAPISLNETGVPSENIGTLVISPDGDYAAISTFSPERAVYSVKLADGTRVRLSENFPNANGFANNLTIDSLSKRVVYRADAEIQSQDQIYSAPLRGGAAVRLSALDRLDARLDSSPIFQVAPGGSPVVYAADQRLPGVFELFAGSAQAFWTAASGAFEDSANWQGGVLPDETVEAVLATDGVARVSDAGSSAVVDGLQLGGSTGSSILEFSNGAGLTVCNGVALYAGAILRGDGVLALAQAALEIPAGAEVRSGTGESFLLQSGAVTNAGRLEALGTLFQPAEIEFTGAIQNVLGTGAIVGRDATLRFPGGLMNEGSLSFTDGVNDFVGAIDNETGGLIIVSGGAQAVFHGDVNNSGVINVSATGGVVSTAVFLGALSGNGVSGGGHVFIEGDTRPGFSPGTMAFGGDLSYGPFATTEVEIGGTTPGTDHDQVTVAGHLSLSGTLQVTLLNGFVPQVGMVFDLWDAGSVSGQYASVSLPVLPGGMFWNTCDLDTTGELVVALVPESYAEFATHYGLAAPAEGDEDGDRIANAIEYLAGRDPLQGEVWPGIEITASAISFVTALPAAKDLIVELERSTTLQLGGPGGWEVIATRTGNGPWTGSEPVQLSSAGPGLERAMVAHPAVGSTRRFYRLKVTVLP